MREAGSGFRRSDGCCRAAQRKDCLRTRKSWFGLVVCTTKHLDCQVKSDLKTYGIGNVFGLVSRKCKVSWIPQTVTISTPELSSSFRRSRRICTSTFLLRRSSINEGATINTLEASFPHVYAISSSLMGPTDDDGRDTFIVVAARRPLDLEDLETGEGVGMVLDPEQLATLRRRSRGLILTDDFAPVDNLLAPIIRMSERAVDGG